ncbi:TatD family hydrolase [Candidatus Phycosocius spiralis]|uniref:LuxR family transcriptional regulator n=1 Tax=Candidatus Phycosocius spiralis TaxID=2815099 RepID=A0ABQ4PSI8_9PROT|nr:TatD family hydrolase [Candidatus Phycosocius spiralis]GIU65956.1 LuxR family transcriptional regulator [Candidatus Phycosocius spiralis]
MIDSHVNLHHEAFRVDFDDVMRRAQGAGIDGMLTICDQMSSLPQIAALAAAHNHVWHSVGAHPHFADDHLDLTSDQLVAASHSSKAIGIGETGLDFHYNYSKLEAQIQVFTTHIHAARVTGLPLIVHTREADELMADLLEQETLKGAFPILLHCYTSGLELLRRGLDLGAYVSFSGIATFKNAGAVRDAARLVPLDRLLIETDCPYLAPIPKRGQRNEPAFLPYINAFLADFYGVEAAALAARTDQNFFDLFKKAQP